MNSSPSRARLLWPLLAALAIAMSGIDAQATGTATSITGIYDTGLTSSGSLQGAGSADAHWAVTYASTNGGSSINSTYEGAAYVIAPATVSNYGYTPNTSGAQWITAPGATNSSGSSPNTGGDYLPGNGNTGSNEGVYIYTLAFTVTGTGSGTVSSQVQVTLTLAADDQYSVYVNPSGNGTTIPTGTPAGSVTSAWNSTTQTVLQNYGTGSADNSAFVIGTNYIVVVVDNTNNISGSSRSTTTNASGLLVYQTGYSMINGKPVSPEVATWLPLVGVICCYGLIVLRRRKASQWLPTL